MRQPTQKSPTGSPDPARQRPRLRKRVPAGNDGHEGATESRVGDRTGPAVGYDGEPAKVRDEGGVADS